MAYLKADVVQAVLYDLGQVGDDGVVESTDSARVGVRFDALVGLLTQRDIVTINPASIPEYYFEGLKRYLVIECAAMVAGKALDIEALGEALESLRKVSREGVTISGNAEHVIQEVLQNLGALKPGAGPTTRDKGFLSALIDDTLSDLSQRDIITIANQAAIGTSHTRPLIAILTQVAGPKFGKAHDQAAVETAETALYEIARAGYSVSSVADKVIQDVLQLVGRVPPQGAPSTKDRLTVSNLLDNLLADLSARDVITIADQASVTTTHANPLIEILAQIAGPKFGKPYNGEMVGAAEARLFKISRASNTASTVAEKVIYEVLSNVGAVKPGEVPSTRDKTYVSTLFDNLLGILSARDVITIANQAAVTAAQSNPIILYLTQLCAPKFGKAASADAIQAAEKALYDLNRAGASVSSLSDKIIREVLVAVDAIEPDGAPTTKDKTYVSDLFDNLLADLAQRDVISIANQAAVTAAQANALILLLAQLAGPKFGKAYSLEVVQAAEKRLYTLGRTGNTASSAAEKVIYEVLSAVDAVQPGEVPSTRDKTYVSDLFDSLLADLSARDVITIANQAAVATTQVNALTLYLIQLAGPKFGKAYSADAVKTAEERLFALGRAGNSASTLADKIIYDVLAAVGQVQPGLAPSTKDKTYVSTVFDNLLADLSARDVVTIADQTAVTAAQAGYIIKVLTQLVGPKFGREHVGAVIGEAEARLRELGRVSNTTSTVADRIIAEVLLALGGLGVGQLPSTKDKTYVSSLIDNALATWSARDVITIANQAAITTAHANSVITYVIELARPKFQEGKPSDRDAMALAETELRTLARQGSIGGTTADRVVATVLRQFGKLRPGEAPSAKEAAFVSETLVDTIADLTKRDVIVIASASVIPSYAVDPLADYVAERCAERFGRARNVEALLAAEARLRTAARFAGTLSGNKAKLIAEVLQGLGRVQPGDAPTATDTAFVEQRLDAAVAELANNDIITISTSSISNAVFNPLAAYLRTFVAAKFGGKVEKGEVEAAEARLRMIDRMGRTVGSTVSDKLVARVLRGLRALGPTEGPTTKEATAVSDRFEGILADLTARRMSYLVDVEDVTDAGQFEALADYIVAVLGPDYPQSGLTFAGRQGLMRDAEVRLKRMGQPAQVRKLRVDTALLPSRRTWNFSSGR